jgi:hypothetical protein
VDEVIRACRVSLDAWPRRDGALASIRSAVDRHLDDLGVMCLKPDLFGSERTYDEVRGFREKLTRLRELLSRDPETASRYWRKEMRPAVEPVLRAVLAQAQSLLTR